MELDLLQGLMAGFAGRVCIGTAKLLEEGS